MSSVATPIRTPDDEALAWVALAQRDRWRAEGYRRCELGALASGHPASAVFAAFYAAAADDALDRARFCDDCARAALEGA